MTDQFLSEIRIVSFNYAPTGWALCNGQILPISQYAALFALLGTTYGGNGQTTFALPNLQGRIPIGWNGSSGLGVVGGEEMHTLIVGELGQHTHFLWADATTDAKNNSNTPAPNTVLGQSIGLNQQDNTNFDVKIYGTAVSNKPLGAGVIGNIGKSNPHENRQPYLVLNYIIALVGIFPSRN